MNLHGPSMTVDSMCSSSLTALHLACQDFKNGVINAALAGGVNISIHPNKYLTLSQGGFISSQGKCQSFGDGGEGYIPGEGVGVIFLKRLEDAIESKDHIYGLIKGSALNHGGKTNGYTVPNPNSQQQVITSAMLEAGVSPQQISYVEAHGTGTSLGDPIEITGLTKAFGDDVKLQSCLIGSVKSNIGHCESAAGIAGITKILLQMQHEKIVPSLHSKILNKNIDFTKTPFRVNQKLTSWPKPIVNGIEQNRLASISSFGAGGSNAHLVLEEYISSCDETKVNKPALIVLSAKTIKSFG